MKKIIAVLMTMALMLMSAAALGEGNALTPVELNVDSLEYVDETHYLIARDADSRLYGLYNTDGEMLIPCEYGLLAYAEYGFFEAINEDGLNTHALLRADGQAVTGWEYAAFEILKRKVGPGGDAGAHRERGLRLFRRLPGRRRALCGHGL